MKKVKLTYGQIEDALTKVTETANVEIDDPKVRYAVSKVQEKLQQEQAHVEKSIEPPKEFIKERNKLAEEHAERDDHGRMKTQQITPKRAVHLMKNQQLYDEAFEALKVKHNIAEFEKKTEDFLATEVEFDFYPIPLKAGECPWKKPQLLTNVLRFVAD